MAKLKWKGGALVAPVPPAMISCGNEADGNSNIITIAWTGTSKKGYLRNRVRGKNKAARTSRERTNANKRYSNSEWY